MLSSFKNRFSMSSGLSSGCKGEEKVISLSHCGGMSDVKMQTPVEEGRIKDLFLKTVYSKRCVPICFSFLHLPIFLLLFSLVTPALSIHMEAIGSHSEFSCEPIRLRMCQDLPYNTTFMPNLLNHYDQQTAALAMEVGCLDVAFRWCVLCLTVCECVRKSDSCCLEWDGGWITFCLKKKVHFNAQTCITVSFTILTGIEHEANAYRSLSWWQGAEIVNNYKASICRVSHCSVTLLLRTKKNFTNSLKRQQQTRMDQIL